MRLSTIDFEGNTIWSTTETVAIGANESKIHFSAPTATLLEGNAKEKAVFKAELLTENGALIASNLLYFSAPKNLKLPNPSIETETTSTEEGYKIKLSSNLLAKNIYLRYEGAEGFFSDNYF
ncbi:MAG: glycoside hydrolase family 2 protein, partial [Phaeodactylibacter sp.]|nr:glycoside hydrolase family 2 protein [Phaeodactylibacter sp.]